MQPDRFGLGRMIATMVQRLMKDGHECVIKPALFGRFEPLGDTNYADRLISAVRKQFGGHDEKAKGVG